MSESNPSPTGKTEPPLTPEEEEELSVDTRSRILDNEPDFEPYDEPLTPAEEAYYDGLAEDRWLNNL